VHLENEFLVDAPLDQTWSTLLDIRRVAQCLPGAVLETGGEDGTYRGSMQVKLGPMSLKYKGTARMAEVEEDSHNATIEVQAKELKGQGTASARIRNQLSPGPEGGTKVTVQTDLSITGRPAQFGRGIMEDVASKMLEDFAKRLEGEVLRTNGRAPAEGAGPAQTAGAEGGATASLVGAEGAAAGGPADAAGPAEGAAQPAEAAELDLGAVLLGPLAKRAVIGAVVVMLLVLLRLAIRGRKTGLSVTVRWR
jgi:carbon monoxide dehydrogenase subunit G